MFEGSLVESTTLLRARSRKPVVTAIVLQVTLVAALLSIPLLHPEVLPLRAPQLLLTAPPMPAPRPPDPPRVRVQELSAANAPTTSLPEAAPIIGASYRPTAGPAPDSIPSLAPIGMGNATTGLPTVLTSGVSGPAVSVRPEPAAHKGLLSISSGVLAGNLLVPIRPVYPQIARLTHTEGAVVIEAIISTSGRIESAHVVSGPVMLQAAALDAVRSARYRPYQLNGQPTEVQTTITVNFRMGG